MSRPELVLDLDLVDDSAATASVAAEPSNSHIDPELARKPWLEKLPALLRAFGAAAVIFSLYSFLFRGWEGSDDLMRYGMLLGHTVLLVVIALLSGNYFRDGKGPRLLMMLSLLSVPINFAILGAFIFAGVKNLLAADAALQYPSYVAWSVGSLDTALILAFAVCVALIPVTLVAFKTLVRGMSNPVSALFLAGNLLLLVPLRDPLLVFVVTSALAIITVFISAKTARQRTEVKTFEGMIAMMLLFMPVAILLGRNLWLYAADSLLLLGMAGCAFIVLRHVAGYLAKTSGWRVMLECVSVAIAIFSGLSLSFLLFDSRVNDALALALGGLLAAAMTYEVAQRAEVMSGLYRSLAVLILLLSSALNLIFISGAAASVITLVCGIASAVLGYQKQQRSVFVGGILMTLAGLSDQVINAFNYFDFSYWLGLAIVGIVAIVLASMLESKGKQMKAMAKKYRQGYAGWSV